MLLEDLQRAGFPMGGEPLVAIDLADTVMLAVNPPIDLLSSERAATAWWELQAPRLPVGPAPSLAETRRLRAAIRHLIEARDLDPGAIDTLNAIAAQAPASPRLSADGLRETRWHGGDARLAAVAGEAIALLADSERLDLLRRCANPACSMLFLAENKRRRWCAPNVCGNRVRVARHHERHRPA
ncbi:CGNR zinc finger domain-containing protein [Actinoplanes sp. CA-142083]|uniref:CGNR zinc finger domain-containing protein n=1 Tax=Actinoplanes sp. CA-142083 TaxID=3239903 RepID=UPI003D8D17F9